MYRIVLVLLLLLVALSPIHAEDKKFVISYFHNAQMPLAIEIVRKSYADIGIETSFVELPVERGLKMLEQGHFDADVARNSLVLGEYEHIVSLPTRLVTVDLLLLCQKNLPDCSAEILSDPDINIGAFSNNYRSLQLKWGDKLKAGYIDLSKADDVLDLLARGRINYSLYPAMKNNIPAFIKRDYHYVSLIDLDAIHVVHEKHAHLVKDLDVAVQKNLAAYYQSLQVKEQ